MVLLKFQIETRLQIRVCPSYVTQFDGTEFPGPTLWCKARSDAVSCSAIFLVVSVENSVWAFSLATQNTVLEVQLI